MKRAIVIFTCLSVVSITLLFVIPTAVIGFEDGFRSHHVSSVRSLDGTLELIVTKRVAFPANEWVDPSIVVRAELRDVATRRVIASERKTLVEDSDFSPPVIQWNSGEVRVAKFDQRKDQSLALKYQP